IWCGLRMLEEPKRAIKMNAWFWATQIPYVMSSIAGYFFASGSLLYVIYEPSQAHVSMLWRFGSQFQYSLFEAGKPFVFGVNLLALFVFLWLIYRSRRVA